MLFWLFISILALGIFTMILNRYDFNSEQRLNPIINWIYYNENLLCAISFGMNIISAFCITISLFFISANYLTADSFVEKSKERYKILNYKLENEQIKDEFGLVNKEIIDEIQDWNEDVVSYQELQDDFWLGVYFPNIYDQFETIELK